MMAALLYVGQADAVIVYDNGDPDGANGLSDIFSVEIGIDREVADDFSLTEPVIVQDFQYSIIWNTLEADVARSHRVRFYDDAGGVPAVTPFSDQTITSWSSATGGTYFGRTEIIYTADLNTGVPLDPGTTYWVSMQPEGPENAFWLTTTQKGGAVYVDYPDAGFPKWTPGIDVFGEDYDVSFKLTGTIVPEPSTLLVWSLLAALGIGAAWSRRK